MNITCHDNFYLFWNVVVLLLLLIWNKFEYFKKGSTAYRLIWNSADSFTKFRAQTINAYEKNIQTHTKTHMMPSVTTHIIFVSWSMDSLHTSYMQNNFDLKCCQYNKATKQNTILTPLLATLNPYIYLHLPYSKINKKFMCFVMSIAKCEIGNVWMRIEMFRFQASTFSLKCKLETDPLQFVCSAFE